VLVDGGSTRFSKYFASLGEKGLREWLAAGFDKETGKSLAPSFATLEELYAVTWKRFGKPDDPTEMYDVLSQAGQTKAGRWVRMRPAVRRWLQQDTLSNMLRGMLQPDEASSFFASTVMLDPIKVFQDLRVPILILDATGNGKDYRDSTPTSDNEQLQKMHPRLIEHKKLSVGHFVHRAAPVDFLKSLASFRERLQAKKGK